MKLLVTFLLRAVSFAALFSVAASSYLIPVGVLPFSPCHWTDPCFNVVYKAPSTQCRSSFPLAYKDGKDWFFYDGSTDIPFNNTLGLTVYHNEHDGFEYIIFPAAQEPTPDGYLWANCVYNKYYAATDESSSITRYPLLPLNIFFKPTEHSFETDNICEHMRLALTGGINTLGYNFVLTFLNVYDEAETVISIFNTTSCSGFPIDSVVNSSGVMIYTEPVRSIPTWRPSFMSAYLPL